VTYVVAHWQDFNGDGVGDFAVSIEQSVQDPLIAAHWLSSCLCSCARTCSPTAMTTSFWMPSYLRTSSYTAHHPATCECRACLSGCVAPHGFISIYCRFDPVSLEVWRQRCVFARALTQEHACHLLQPLVSSAAMSEALRVLRALTPFNSNQWAFFCNFASENLGVAGDCLIGFDQGSGELLAAACANSLQTHPFLTLLDSRRDEAGCAKPNHERTSWGGPSARHSTCA
jgi:hypothetical protein